MHKTLEHVPTELTPSGLVLVDVMLGPYSEYPAGSELWARALAAHLQVDIRTRRRERMTADIIRTLKDAIEASPHPWELWPPEANGDPKRWIKLVTGEDWDKFSSIPRTDDPTAWVQISDAIASWEATHRTAGNPTGVNQYNNSSGNGCVTSISSPREHVSASGIRRRLKKRAAAGDAVAAELDRRLAAGEITPNAAAIASGMRSKYLRLSVDCTPQDALDKLRSHYGEDWCLQLTGSCAESDPISYVDFAFQHFTRCQIIEISDYLIDNLDEAQPDDPESLPELVMLELDLTIPAEPITEAVEDEPAFIPESIPEPVAEAEATVEPEPPAVNPSPALEDAATPKHKGSPSRRYSPEERAAIIAAIDSGRKKIDVAREWGMTKQGLHIALNRWRQTG